MRTVQKVERTIPQHLPTSPSPHLNIYIHFPFCRSKCAYCALHSSVGRSSRDRRDYVARIIRDLKALFTNPQPATRNPQLTTLYFGGGTPALCDLQPILDFLSPHLNTSAPPEFTVELNPLDVTPELLRQLKAGGVNRLSMGVQSFDDPVLREMGRPHTSEQASQAWRMIRDEGFGNAGIDLICGWPAERHNGMISDAWRRSLDEACALAPDHCSVYTLILEPDTRLSDEVSRGKVTLPSDDIALAELAEAERRLADIGLERYEISNFSKPGMECRHNLAVWHGEDYTGIGDGACSREGSAVSRVIFRLRLLKEGFNPSNAAADFPELAPRVQEWCATLDRFVSEGLLSARASDVPGNSPTYLLTARGTEVCDTILAELV